MAYDPSPEQRAVITTDAPVAVVIGGAGSGKTTTAAAAAAHRLESRSRSRAEILARKTIGTPASLPPVNRVLFVSFSRTAVRQILDRAAEVLGQNQRMVDVVTFHGLAWRVLNNFGRFYGYPHPLHVQSSAETALSAPFPGVTYGELLPAATELLDVPAVAEYYGRRYGTVICDEFQDTSTTEWTFIQSVAPTASRIFLGDPNQCIYADMKDINPHARVAEAAALPGAVKFNLPALSYRDPSGALPSAAFAAMKREFDDPSIAHAVRTGRIVLHHVVNGNVAEDVAAIVAGERSAANSVCVFTHTKAATAELSTTLTAKGVLHEQVGLSEALGDGLQAQFACLRWALNGHPGARVALAAYVRSISSGKHERQMAEAIVHKSAPALESKLATFTEQLRATACPTPDYDGLLTQLAGLHRRLELPRGEDTWHSANDQLRRALRALHGDNADSALAIEIASQRVANLIGSHALQPKPVQVMNLHQTKGREADATVLMLQPGEYHGSEAEPYPKGSRLLYVCLTRARERAHIVLPSNAASVHGLWAPFVNACALAELD